MNAKDSANASQSGQLRLTSTDVPIELKSLTSTTPLRIQPLDAIDATTFEPPKRAVCEAAAERGAWARHTDYLLSAMGYSISIRYSAFIKYQQVLYH